MINANEQRVIDVASGTFEYQGKIYRAKASYISQLTAKLDRENVDLSAAGANAAIGQIMANVGTGVKQGYLEEVRETEKERNSEKSKGDSGSQTGNRPKDQEENESETKSGVQTKKDNPGDKTEDGTGDAATGGNDGTTSGDAGYEMPDQTGGAGAGDAGTEANAGAGIIQIYPEEAEKVEFVQKFTDNAGIANQTSRAFGQYMTVAAVIWVLCIVGTAVYLKKVKRRKKMAGGLVGIILTGAAWIAIGFGYLFGREACEADRWGQVVTGSAYLKESYDDVAAVMQECLERAGLPKETLDSCMEENAVYRDAKILAVSDGNAKQSVWEKRDLAIREAIAAAAPGLDGEQQIRMAQVLVQKYKDGLGIPWQLYLEKNREAGRTGAWICFMAGGIAMAAGILVLKLKTRYLHRAVRGLHLGCLIGGAGFLLSGVFGGLVGAPLVIEPEKYKELLENYVQSVCQSGLYLGILLLCAGLALGIVSYFMKTRIE